MYEKRTEELISPILEENHFELVDVEFVKEARKQYYSRMICLEVWLEGM